MSISSAASARSEPSTQNRIFIATFCRVERNSKCSAGASVSRNGRLFQVKHSQRLLGVTGVLPHLEPERLDELQHPRVLAKHRAFEPREALALRRGDQPLHQRPADALSLPGVVHDDRVLGAGAVGILDVARDAGEGHMLRGPRILDDGDERQLAVVVDLREPGEHRGRELVHPVEEPQVARLVRQAVHEPALELRRPPDGSGE